MANMNKDLIKEIIRKYPYISNPSSFKKCGDILCIACYVNNFAPYFILYPDGHIKYKQFDDWEYTSSFNKDGTGNSLVFVDLSTQEIIKIYYFKDDLSFDCPIELKESSETFIIAEHEERTHIIYLDDFSVHSFGGTNYRFYYPYILFLPYGVYSTYVTFALVNLDTKIRIDLHSKLKDFLSEIMEYGWLFEEKYKIEMDSVNINCKNLDSKESIKFNIKDLFCQNKNNNLDIEKSIKTDSEIIELQGKWDKGFSLDEHTIKSTINGDGTFNTVRTYIGQLLYELKYQYNRENIELLTNIILNEFNDSIRFMFNKPIDVIIPIPPSNSNRPFQPLQELCNSVSFKLGIPYDKNYLNKDSSAQIKEISDSESRKSILKKSLTISGLKYKGKTILLFDDLFRSGDTLNTVAELLKKEGQVGNIYVLTVTKTRVKR